MSYAKRADLEARFGADEIERLGGDDKIAAALADAVSEIDAALGEVYDLPLPAGSYPLLAGLACDLARERLHDDDAPETVTDRAKAARKTLESLVAGELTLFRAAASEGVRRRPAGARATGPKPVMTPETLGGL